MTPAVSTRRGTTPVSDERQRVQKLLAAAGIASRRACEELIAAGRVTVNGEVVTLGAKADPASDVVAVDGEHVNVDPGKVYILLNKPRGVVTTAEDPEGRPTVLDLVNLPQRLFPVGRLDIDTEGLLLLTNDGELAHALMHPSYEVERVYVALVPGPVKNRSLAAVREGVELADGVAAATAARVLEEERGKALVELTMAEGRKREVRRLLDAVGLPVERLARVAYADVELGELRQGKWRFLTQQEVGRLFAAVERGGADAGSRRRRAGPPKQRSDRAEREARSRAARSGGREGRR